jgi:hypothetical protein
LFDIASEHCTVGGTIEDHRGPRDYACAA